MIRAFTNSAFCVCLLFVLSGCGKLEMPVSDDVKEWVTHKDGNISVKLPSKPKLQTQDIKHPLLGKVQIKMYICEISPRAGFMVSQVKYPVDPKRYNVAAGLKGAVQGMAKETKGTIISEKEKKMGSIPGKEVLMSAPDSFMAKAWIFIDGKGPTLYQFQAIGDKEFLDKSMVGDFFNSIKVTPIGGGDSGSAKTETGKKSSFE